MSSSNSGQRADFTWPWSRVCALVTNTVLVTCAIALVCPLLRPGFTWGHDIAAHPTYAYFFDRALRQGQLPVRWIEWVEDGYGQPLFNFYQVGFYYLVELVHLVVPSLSLSLKLTIVGLWLTGGAFVFLLFRPLGFLAAAFGASVFVWSPYLMLDAYVRNAYPEMAAISLTPGVLWSINRLIRGNQPRYAAALALSTALVVISHLPTALIVAPLCAAYALAVWAVTGRGIRRITFVALGAVLGAGMASFYAVPALVELPAIKIGKLTTGDHDYHLHFVEPRQWFGPGQGPSAEGGLLLQLGAVQWMVIAAAVATIGLSAYRRRERLGQARDMPGWVLAIAAALFLMTRSSQWLWEAVAPLAYVQFPWRFLMVPTIGCAALAAILLSKVRSIAAQTLIVVCASGIQWNAASDEMGKVWRDARADIRIDDPAWAGTANGRAWAFREAGYDPVTVTRETRNAPGRWVVTAGQAAVAPIAVKDDTLVLTVDAAMPVTLRVNEPFFPGWTIAVNGESVAPRVMAGSGYMEVDLPPGSHRVDASFGATRVRTVAQRLTLGSLAACAAILLLARTPLRPAGVTKARSEARDAPLIA